MVSFYPAAVVFLPLALVASKSQKRALLFFLASVPLFDVTVFTAISHPFNVPELGIFAILFSLLTNLRNDSTVGFTDRVALISAVGFLMISSLSIILLIVRPTSILVNPYGYTPDDFILQAVTISFSNITQLLLRAFFVTSVFVIGLTVDPDNLEFVTRAVILGAIFAGFIGVIYQLFAILQSDLLINFLYWFGGTGRPEGMGSLGPLPRMASVTGEPGHTAQYLLYVFAVSATLIATGSYNVFSRETLSGVLIVIGGLLLLSTSGTAYGGLIIFSGVILVGAISYKPVKISRLARTVGPFALLLVFLAVILAALDIVPIADITTQQFRKLTFRSGSGTIRARYFRLTADVLRERPFFGLGTGSYYSTSLIGTIVGETGIVGLTAFFALCLGCARPALSHAVRYRTHHHLSFALVVGITTLVLTSLVAKSITTLLSPWFWVALGLPLSLAIREDQGVSTEVD
jgi:hypothetical protein